MTVVSSARSSWPRQVAAMDEELGLELRTDRLPASTWDPANVTALREQLAEDGFLFLPSLLPVELIANARHVIVSDLASNGFVSSSTAEHRSAPLYITSPPAISPKLLDRNDLQRHPTILAAVESPRLRTVMSSLLGAPSSLKVKTHPYKWLRAVGPGLFTGPHVDSTYFPATQYPSLLTAWIPMAATTPSLGSLMIAPDLKSVPIELGKGSDGTKAGWIKNSEDDFATARWLSADMSMGDVVVIDPTRCVHMSSRNMEVPAQWRISCDTRWWI